ncbi:MAG TPA: AAA family ATPase, partial [Gemmataceae bacterium]|nr:AAA family ATPase [Gemmataceae bacterium]
MSPADDRPDGPPDPAAYCPLWSRDLAPAADDVPWLWHGYLAPGTVTLLTSQWKSGKTTLLSVLLARRAQGSLAGRPLRPGRTAVVCEESAQHWAQRRRTLDFGDDVAFFCRELDARAADAFEWRRLIQSVARLAREGVDLAVFDPLASVLPRHSEGNNDLMREALLGLDPLLSLGMAVLLLHHPRKGATLEGQAARGAGSLPAHADVRIEMRPYSAADDDRRRVLSS